MSVVRYQPHNIPPQFQKLTVESQTYFKVNSAGVNIFCKKSIDTIFLDIRKFKSPYPESKTLPECVLWPVSVYHGAREAYLDQARGVTAWTCTHDELGS